MLISLPIYMLSVRVPISYWVATLTLSLLLILYLLVGWCMWDMVLTRRTRRWKTILVWGPLFLAGRCFDRGTLERMVSWTYE